MNARLLGHERLDRVFRERAERRVREPQPRIVRHLQPRDDAEALRVALEAREVLLLDLAQRRARVRGDRRFFKPHADRIFTRMTERRIAEIVRQRGRGDDRAKIRRVNFWQLAARADRGADDRGERPADARDLEAVREPRAHVVVVREREDLRLVLEPAKGGRKNDAIRIALEWRALRLGVGVAFRAEPVCAEEPGPLHRGHVVFAARRMKS